MKTLSIGFSSSEIFDGKFLGIGEFMKKQSRHTDGWGRQLVDGIKTTTDAVKDTGEFFRRSRERKPSKSDDSGYFSWDFGCL